MRVDLEKIQKVEALETIATPTPKIAFIKLKNENKLPPNVTLRGRIGQGLVSVNVLPSDIKKLQDDPNVISCEIAKVTPRI